MSKLIENIRCSNTTILKQNLFNTAKYNVYRANHDALYLSNPTTKIICTPCPNTIVKQEHLASTQGGLGTYKTEYTFFDNGIPYIVTIKNSDLAPTNLPVFTVANGTYNAGVTTCKLGWAYIIQSGVKKWYCYFIVTCKKNGVLVDPETVNLIYPAPKPSAIATTTTTTTPATTTPGGSTTPSTTTTTTPSTTTTTEEPGFIDQYSDFFKQKTALAIAITGLGSTIVLLIFMVLWKLATRK